MRPTAAIDPKLSSRWSKSWACNVPILLKRGDYRDCRPVADDAACSRLPARRDVARGAQFHRAGRLVMLLGPGAISSTSVLFREHLCPSRRNCGAIPLLRLGVEADGKKQKCHRGSEIEMRARRRSVRR